MPSEPHWITPEGVIQLKLRIVTATGEPHVVLNRNSLSSACDRPRNAYYYDDDNADICGLATSLLFGIARNHPFLQGNKRSAFYAMVTFLEANGFQFELVDDIACAVSIINVLAGVETEDEFCEKLRRVVRRAVPQVWD